MNCLTCLCEFACIVVIVDLYQEQPHLLDPHLGLFLIGVMLMILILCDHSVDCVIW